MKIAIMQPYFFPYLGYFQLINAVEKFVIYDNIKYTKKGWINRNRLLFGEKVEYFTINLKKNSDFAMIKERQISEDYFFKDMPKILRKIEQFYFKADNFSEVYPLITEIFNHKEPNLFRYIYNSLLKILNYLEIKTEILISSTISIDHSLKAADKVIALCKALKARTYINPIGGLELYSKEIFAKENIQLFFLRPRLEEYKQFSKAFEPGLSIIDVMMFNSKDKIKEMLDDYELI